MYPRNNATPERIAIGQVVLIADGTIQTSTVVITVRGQGGAEATGGGTTVYGAEGTVYYTPTQAETNYTSFVVIASKASCFSASQTVITTASSTAGQVDVKSIAGTAQTANDNGADINTLISNQGDWATATGFNTVVPPSLAEFNARSLPSADYTIVSDLGTVQTGDSFARIGVAGAGLTNLGASGNNWNVGKTGYTLTTQDWNTVSPDNASVTAIKAKTDQLTFTIANEVDSNATSMNDTVILGTGINSDKWRG